MAGQARAVDVYCRVMNDDDYLARLRPEETYSITTTLKRRDKNLATLTKLMSRFTRVDFERRKYLDYATGEMKTTGDQYDRIIARIARDGC